MKVCTLWRASHTKGPGVKPFVTVPPGPQAGVQRLLSSYTVTGLLAAVWLATMSAAQAAEASTASTQAQLRGKEILVRFAETNRLWLAGPSPDVKTFSYELHRGSRTQEFNIENPARSSPARLRGVTYSGMLQHLARAPMSVTVLSVTEETNRARLTLRFDPALRGAVGNGVENSWTGYHGVAGEEGSLLIDTERWVPVEAQLGRLHETFGEFVQADPKHLVPLKIRIEVGDSTYDWRFRVYEPGLWLFDDSHSDGRRLAWVEKVSVNSAPSKVAHATASSEALAASVRAGDERKRQFLDANRHWLIPAVEPRRGLAYEYRQEPPYLERVIIDPAGNILARLESSKESPGEATRQHLLLTDGRYHSGEVTNTFIRLDAAPAPDAGKGKGSQRDGLAQHLAMGLALECALTRMAREPEQFWAEARPVQGDANHYLLVLRAKGDARLFTGTMLAFTSWAFMHDVGYDRSEILCETATHRPVEEKDYAGKNELKGHFVFENWLEDPAGAAPGLIRAVIPHQKDGKDQSLEMRAEFSFPKRGVWLLRQVESRFRDGSGSSTGSVQIIADAGALYAKIGDLIRQAEATEKLLSGLGEASDRGSEAPVAGSGWAPLLLKAAWTDKARDSVKGQESRRNGEDPPSPLIGVYRARVVEGAAPSVAVELEGISTASWKEFLCCWQVSLHDGRGRLLATGATNLNIRALNGPTPFIVRVELPIIDPATGSKPAQLQAEGNVERMTGMYHGHGMWMHFPRN